MGKPRQSKEQFIKSRETARAAETKAAEAKRMQDEALARRNVNRTRLDLYRSKLQQQPAQPGMAANPIGRIEARLPQPPIPGMAGNAIGNAVGNQVIGGSGKPMSRPMQQESDQSIAEEANRRELKIKPNQPGMATNLTQQENVQALQDGGLLYNDNVRSLDDVTAGMVPQMSNTPVMMQNIPAQNNTIQKQETTPGLEIFQKKLSDRELKNTFIPENDSGIPYSPEFGGMSGSGKDQSKADIPFRPEFGGMGGSGESVDSSKQSTASAAKKEDTAGNAIAGLKALADAMKPKEELPATQYRSFTVDDNSGEVRDVMSARREALMKMMGGR